jgi:hypothetical protein
VAFDVIDLDGPDASSALAHARAGREGVHGPVVRTGKGFHVFVLPTGLGNRAGVLPGVDFRGVGTATALAAAGQQLGLSSRECERTVASGMSAGMEQPRARCIAR